MPQDDETIRRPPKQASLLLIFVIIVLTYIVDPKSYSSSSINADADAFGTSIEDLPPSLSIMEERVERHRQKIHGKSGAEAEDYNLLVRKLQDDTRRLLRMKYGPEPYHVIISLHYPVLGKKNKTGAVGNFTIELASAQYVPHAVHTFLEMVQSFKKGAFFRLAFHLLQAQIKPTLPLVFTEYSPHVPHLERTIGLTAVDGESLFHISIMDNSHNLGPFSQRGSYTPQSTCFGKVVNGYDNAVQWIRMVPMYPGIEVQRFEDKQVKITHMTLVTKQLGA